MSQNCKKTKQMKKKPYRPENNPHKQNTGLKRLFLAFVNSISGFNFAIIEESAFRQELLLCLFLIPLIFIFPTSPIEKILMIGSLLLLLIVELLTSSIEAAIDRISFSHHDLSKRAKDLGSAAVLVALTLVVITYLSVLTKFLI